MSTNKSIFYLLCNKDIIVNLYKLYFLSSHFSFQPNKRIFHLPTFSSLQLNTYEEKLNIFYLPTNFPSSHFFTPSTKQTTRERLPSYLKLYVSSILIQIGDTWQVTNLTVENKTSYKIFFILNCPQLSAISLQTHRGNP